MTRDDMIRLAREAGWGYANDSSGFEHLWKFGELVAAEEREECAKRLDVIGCDHCAENIRLKGRE